MSDLLHFSELVRSERLIAVVRNDTAEGATRELEALVTAGVRVAEVSLTTPDALEIVRGAPRIVGGCLGVGTVLTPEDVEEAVGAGAGFVVTPTVSVEVLEACKQHELPVVCGGATPTEIVKAATHGATFVKVFPASLYGPPGIAALHAVFPKIGLVPTGGVSVGNAGAYRTAGAVAVGIGSALTAGEPQAIKQRVTRLLRILDQSD